ncbi:adenosine receptor A2b isoform X2 [Harpia harpyja]|uniref:adenosine receptor A2b isoform X2 n=1 Tax=Harpia harpyja TaxID=202280 RepID=UPI0022B19409|nr:adenosine receptor A2b isoform X2 [Harpia harpyja]
MNGSSSSPWALAMDAMKTTYIVLELIIAVLSIAGNVLVCWAVAINSTLKNATNYFLVSLAVADIAVGLLAIPFAITISIGFQVDFHSCLFFACFVLVLTQSSIFSLLAVAIDRYLAIKIPLRQGHKSWKHPIQLASPESEGHPLGDSLQKIQTRGGEQPSLLPEGLTAPVLLACRLLRWFCFALRTV